jgi:hypothetical protein
MLLIVALQAETTDYRCLKLFQIIAVDVLTVYVKQSLREYKFKVGTMNCVQRILVQIQNKTMEAHSVISEMKREQVIAHSFLHTDSI